MNKVFESLMSINRYPIPPRAIMDAMEHNGMSCLAEPANGYQSTAAYKLAKAELYLWLSYAPDITQGGQHYAFTDAQRDDFRRLAKALKAESEEEPSAESGVAYGYKGSRL